MSEKSKIIIEATKTIVAAAATANTGSLTQVAQIRELIKAVAEELSIVYDANKGK